MTVFEELEQIIEEQGIVQISGGVFKEHTTPTGKVRKVNTTVEKYCTNLGKLHGVSGEEYCLELLAIEKSIAAGNGRKITGECRRCWTFMLEGEEHVCDVERVKEHEESQRLWEKIQASLLAKKEAEENSTV